MPAHMRRAKSIQTEMTITTDIVFNGIRDLDIDEDVRSID